MKPVTLPSLTYSESLFSQTPRSSRTWGASLREELFGKLIQADKGGGSVSVSGDTVVVGANGDDDAGTDSGSAYVFRTVFDGEIAFQANDWLGNVLLDGASAAAFGGLELGNSRTFNFEIKNVGTLALDIQCILLGGANAGDFSLTLPDLSSPTDLASGESLSYAVTFQPSGSISSERNATIVLFSNDTPSTLTFNISGLALSSQMDSDNDGLNDFAEYRLRSFGFDWEQQQTNRVNDYFQFASTAGLFTQAEAGAISVGSTVVDTDPTTNTAGVILDLQESTDLENFDPIMAAPTKISIDAQGRIIYEIEATDGKKFYRLGVSGR